MLRHTSAGVRRVGLKKGRKHQVGHHLWPVIHIVPAHAAKVIDKLVLPFHLGLAARMVGGPELLFNHCFTTHCFVEFGSKVRSSVR